MTDQGSGNRFRHFAVLFEGGSLTGLGEGQLLERFLAHRDDVAFSELVARHGPMVLAICRRWLDDPHDVEDAFQATFLVLVRKAGSLRDRTALSSWLYGVSLRVARRARSQAARRRNRERPMVSDLAERCAAAANQASREVRAILDDELARLPESQRTVVLLCLVDGLTHEEAARALSWPLGTVKSRLAAARKKLVRRLTGRGLAPSSVALGTTFSEIRSEAALPTDLAHQTVNTALQFVAGTSGEGETVSASIASLVRGVIRAMAITHLKSIAIVLAALGTAVWATPAFLAARQDPAPRQLNSSPKPPLKPAHQPDNDPPTLSPLQRAFDQAFLAVRAIEDPVERTEQLWRLGFAQTWQGKRKEALATFRKALRRGVDQTELELYISAPDGPDCQCAGGSRRSGCLSSNIPERRTRRFRQRMIEGSWRIGSIWSHPAQNRTQNRDD